MTRTQNPTYLDQDKLRCLSDNLIERLEDLFEEFDVDLTKNGKKYFGGCPIHGGGDDKSPFNLFFEGEYYKGNWVCRSHHCEKTFKKSLIGFVRGLLSRQKGWTTEGDKEVSFNDTVEWILKWLGQDFNNIKVDKDAVEKNKFINQSRAITKRKQEGLKIDPKIIRETLRCPSAYFVKRGYDKQILEKYYVGDCYTSGKEMYNRAVVPIFDDSGKFVVGVTGRSLFEQCNKCKLWHNPDSNCPHTDLEKYLAIKWRHNKDFQAENHLYNFWNAKQAIEKSHSICLVESPGNVWKLIENGIENCVATFGSYLTDDQMNLLMSTGCLVLNLIYDNDEAGRLAVQNIKDKAGKMYNINHIKVEDVNDISDMKNSRIQTDIIPKIVNYKL